MFRPPRQAARSGPVLHFAATRLALAYRSLPYYMQRAVGFCRGFTRGHCRSSRDERVKAGDEGCTLRPGRANKGNPGCRPPTLTHTWPPPYGMVPFGLSGDSDHLGCLQLSAGAGCRAHAGTGINMLIKITEARSESKSQVAQCAPVAEPPVSTKPAFTTSERVSGVQAIALIPQVDPARFMAASEIQLPSHRAG